MPAALPAPAAAAAPNPVRAEPPTSNGANGAATPRRTGSKSLILKASGKPVTGFCVKPPGPASASNVLSSIGLTCTNVLSPIRPFIAASPIRPDIGAFIFCP